MQIISKKGYTIMFNEETGSATFCYGGVSFTQKPVSFPVLHAETKDEKILFSIDCGKITLACTYSVEEDETGLFGALSLASRDAFSGKIQYPAAPAVEKGVREIVPYGDGLAFYVEEDISPFDEEHPLFGGSWNSMCFYTLSKEIGYMMTAILTNADAYLMYKKNAEGLFETGVQWQDEMGKWGYTRNMRFYLGTDNPITGSCRSYRALMKQQGKFKTLRDKTKKVPTVDKVMGSAILWLWNKDSMDKLYNEHYPYAVPTKEQLSRRKEVAKELKDAGLHHILWSIFDENVDVETVDYVKSLGYPVSMYQIYTDVIPAHKAEKIPDTRRKRCESRMSYWPAGIMLKPDGTSMPAWELKGKDGNWHSQDRLCDQFAADHWVHEVIPKEVVENHIEGVMIDVCWTCTFECYHKDHPQTRRQSIKNKQRLFESLGDMGLFRGTENGHEDSVCCCEYNEGMSSLSLYRAYDAGRRMTHVYRDDDIAPAVLGRMLNPRYRVPLWQLVYHDCQAANWYWGDSTCAYPQLAKLRDSFNLLYGTTPFYSVSEDRFDELKDTIYASYHRTVPSARALRYEAMTDFAYLKEDMTVQKTRFSDGTEIVVNFGEEDFVYKGTVLHYLDNYIEKE